MLILALYNAKGGVGKTATAVNLAWLSAGEGLKTLLWDLDPQASSTYYYRLKPKVKGSIKKMIGDQDRFLRALKATEYERLDVLPADFDIRHADIILGDMKKSRKQLKRLLKDSAFWYDVIIIDSPPGISLLADNVLRVAGVILVPLIPTTLSVRSFAMIDQYCRDEEIDGSKLHPFFSLVDSRRREHLDTMASFRQSDPRFLESIIPALSEIEKMGVKQAPLPVYSPHSRATKAYEALWAELRQKTDPSWWLPALR